MAFKSYYSHFEYYVILFGLTNALAMFQSYINKILPEKLDIFIIVYLNDIFIYPKNEGKEHMKAV